MVQVIPLPRRVETTAGVFVFDEGTRLVLSDPENEELRRLGAACAEAIRDTSGIELPPGNDTTPSEPNTITLRLADGAAQGNDEGYRLEVSPRSIAVSANRPAGIFYGLQTLRQILTRGGISAVEIEDAPRFSYRGMHLDVARHFFPVAFIKKYIDLLAMHKLNRFHWHLTDDQGWRIEINRYPRLAEVGAFRKETILEKNADPYIGDGQPHGGFYTQDDVREVVAYARERYVTVIPEIELPGHSMAALAAYPALACTEGPFEVATRWGGFDEIYCPKEQTFRFLEHVLTEVADLFPGLWVHIGGDEVSKKRWVDCGQAQAVIEQQGLADEQELQSYFIERIGAVLRSHGRCLIGWDEILDADLTAEATVMSWRGINHGIAAARRGHDVVMTPTSHCYFDYCQADADREPLAIGGFTPLEKVYAFEPIPDELTTEEAAHIVGTQGNVWTEYMKTAGQVEYMVMPRMLALSEVAWSPKEARDWDGFAQRVRAHLELLDAFEVNYRPPGTDFSPSPQGD